MPDLKILEILKHLPNPDKIEMQRYIDDLREENQRVQDENATLKQTIAELKAPSNTTYDGPTCPNCSIEGRPHYLSEIGDGMKGSFGYTHACSQCTFTHKSQQAT